MKQIFTFLLLTFLSFQLYSQCPSSIAANGSGNRIFLIYGSVADLNSAETDFGAGPSVEYNGISYPLQKQPTNIRFRNNPAATSAVFSTIATGAQSLTFPLDGGGSLVCTYNDGALPVDLLFFSATNDKRAKDNIVLEWATASEQNNSHFIIEHSADGRNFTTLEKIEGMGTYDDLTEYSFTHEKIQTAKNYYRLKQVDFDGEFVFSAVEQINLTTSNVSIKQTLVDNTLQVNYDIANATNASYQVLNAAGQSVQTGFLDAYNTQQAINVSDLNDGIYFFQVIANGELTVVKFVKN